MHSRSMMPYIAALLLAATIMIAGCTAPSASSAQASASPVQSGGDDSRIIEIDSMTSVDAALVNGPVLIEFGAPWCAWCSQEKPVVAGLADEYPTVAFFEVNSDDSPGMVKDFYVKGIPQMEIIVRKNPDGSYQYIDAMGTSVTDRYKSRIVGYRTREELKPLIDAAVAVR
ncbi:MAG TPA: thioredoxin family protein [Methanocella sp.]|nr:thioredoxin family protein [Methanocella sp.]